MQRIFASLAIALALTACQSSNPGSDMAATNSGPSGGKFPYGKKVPGKDGLVYSPYSNSDVYIDVRGFKRGDQAKDPWTQKIFLVP